MPRRSPIIAHHLIWTLYGHWLPNDLRGSGSSEVRKQTLDQLGPIYHGRKPEHLQPTRDELRAFHRKAEPILEFPRIWLDDAKRQAVASAFSEVVAREQYTVWAFAVLSNHAHLVIRRHRDDALTMWNRLGDAVRVALADFPDVGCEHPVLSTRPFKVFLRTLDEVRSRIFYVAMNPEKEGLPPQHYSFVVPYDNWPYHKALSH